MNSAKNNKGIHLNLEKFLVAFLTYGQLQVNALKLANTIFILWIAISQKLFEYRRHCRIIWGRIFLVSQDDRQRERETNKKTLHLMVICP